ncbi:MAG: RnfABCDGE type electron transport complex subunit D [Bacilli bacterium]|nr:RnfABCDGE type electron transport complex subunit D [Bacilli bacterium]
MNAQRKFPLGKAPFIRKADTSVSTSRMMKDFSIALFPLILFAWVKNGLMPYIAGDVGLVGMLYPLLFVIVGGASSLLIEGLYFMIFMKEKDLKKRLQESFAVIPGLLLAMILPLHTPIWVLILGCVFATVVGKLLFGGFGYNLFNPALIGYLFVMTAYYGVITSNGGYLNASEVAIEAGVTPLTHFFGNPNLSLSEIIAPYGNMGNFLFGLHPGSIAETSTILCILACVYLIVRKVINWRVPVLYLGGVFVLTYIIGATRGYALDLRYPLFQLFNGGLAFGAVFMATEPVTTPRTPNGKVVFALLLASLTVMLRFASDMSEGVATSILFLNMMAPLIDRSMAKARVGGLSKKVIITYCIFGVAILAIFGFTLMQIGV